MKGFRRRHLPGVVCLRPHSQDITFVLEPLNTFILDTILLILIQPRRLFAKLEAQG